MSKYWYFIKLEHFKKYNFIMKNNMRTRHYTIQAFPCRNGGITISVMSKNNDDYWFGETLHPLDIFEMIFKEVLD